jgi:hypothetical protein
MFTHGHDFWYYGFPRPLNTKHFCQFSQILGRSFSYREDGVAEPTHTELT